MCHSFIMEEFSYQYQTQTRKQGSTYRGWIPLILKTWFTLGTPHLFTCIIFHCVGAACQTNLHQKQQKNEGTFGWKVLILVQLLVQQSETSFGNALHQPVKLVQGFGELKVKIGFLNTNNYASLLLFRRPLYNLLFCVLLIMVKGCTCMTLPPL